MTKNIHQDDKFRNVGMIELVNEPLQGSEKTDSMRKGYYPDAWKVSILPFIMADQQYTDTTSVSAILNRRSELPRRAACTSR